MADGFIWYELATNDVDEAAKFYGRVVGWDIRDAKMPGSKYLIFGKDGKDVGGIMSWAGADQPAQQAVWMGHIHTSNLDRELDAVTTDGGAIVKPAQKIPGVGRFAVVTDPQAVKYLLFEPSEGSSRAALAQSAPGNVGWHELLTDDAARAFEYYSKHYGWQKDYAHDMGPAGIYQTFRTVSDLYTGGIMNRKGPGMPENIPQHWQYYFTVEDIEGAVSLVKESAGQVTMGPMRVPNGGFVLQGVDAQGGHFALTQNAKA